MNSKNNLIENKIPERVRSVRGGTSLEQKNSSDNRHFARIFNEYQSNVKQVLYEIGVTGLKKNYLHLYQGLIITILNPLIQSIQ